MAESSDRHWSQDMALRYDELLGPTVFQPFAEDLARRVAEHRPSTVLEVAAGSGRLTRELLRSLPTHTEVVATDLNPAMVVLGSRLCPDVTWQVAAAGQLPFEDDSFDLLVCQFGVMFFPDKSAAWADFARVLRPGGLALVTTWTDASEHAYADALVHAVEDVCGEDPPTFVVRVPHGYHDEDSVRADAEAAGLREVRVHRVTLDGHADSVAAVGRGFATGTPLAAELAARGDLDEAAERIAEVMVRELGPGPVSLPMTALIVEGRA